MKKLLPLGVKLGTDGGLEKGRVEHKTARHLASVGGGGDMQMCFVSAINLFLGNAAADER